MEQGKKVRVSMCKNGNMKDARVVVIESGDWKDLLKTSSNKFKFKAKRVFNSNGQEIFEDDVKNTTDIVKEIYSNPKNSFVMSDGKDFVGFVGSSQPKTNPNAAVGTFGDASESETQDPESVKPVAPSKKEPTIRVLCKESYVEEEAIKQLEFTAKLPHMLYAIGMPDLHPGKGFPIGSACASESVLYPHLVGTDIGCGMTLTRTSIKKKNAKNFEKWVNKLYGLESPWDGDLETFLRKRNVEPTEMDASSLGTIGGGNHFAELQEIEEVLDSEEFSALGLSEEFLVLLVHSGSRSFGYSVLEEHLDNFGQRGLIENSVEALHYMKRHDHAVEWARANRDLITIRFLNALQGSSLEDEIDESLNENVKQLDTTGDYKTLGALKVLDIVHNSVIKKEFFVEEGVNYDTEKEQNSENANNGRKKMDLWLHRKGAAPSDVGAVVIPGSRGAMSYLVKPCNNEVLQQYGAFSLAHGAGRKWPRGKALQSGKFQDKSGSSFTTTELGSKVICEDKDLLFEEQPDAYKEIGAIIKDLTELKLIKVIAILRPLITYKVRATAYGNK